MKNSPLLLVLLGAMLLVSVPQVSLADNPAPSASNQDDRMERMKAALQKLDLTDAQKVQIRHIRETTTDRRERFTQIMAILTPDQKAKLREMMKAGERAKSSN